MLMKHPQVMYFSCSNFKYEVNTKHTFTLEKWSPIFTGHDGQTNIQVPGFWFAVGIPKCNQKQMWPIYYYPTVNKFKFKLVMT